MLDTVVWLVIIGYFLWGLVAWLRSRRPPSVEELWRMGNRKRDSVLEYSHILDDYLHVEREIVRAMEADSIRLRERFKHDAAKQRQIAQDWCDYAGAVDELKDSREFLDVDSADNAFERHHERTKESSIAIQEIGNRVMNALGDQSNLKFVLAEIEAEDASELTFEQKTKRIEARRRKPPGDG